MDDFLMACKTQVHNMIREFDKRNSSCELIVVNLLLIVTILEIVF